MSEVIAQDWVPVVNEPRHQLVFENSQAIILDVDLPPGYVSLYHEHRIDLLYVTISGSQVWAEELYGERMDVNVPTGDLRFSSDNHDLPHIHRVGNVGQRPFRIIGIGRKDTTPTQAQGPAISGNTRGLILDQEKTHASVFRIKLKPGEKTGEHRHHLPHAQVFMNDGVLAGHGGTAQVVTEGQFLWQSGGISHHYENQGSHALEIVEVQWR